MGLTIHYSLSLPRRFSAAKAKEKIEALRQCCLDLPFKEVGEMRTMAKADGDCMNWNDDKYDLVKGERPPEWEILYHSTCRFYWRFKGGKPVILPHVESLDTPFDLYRREILPETVIGFSLWPGEGCEDCNVYMGLPPKEAPFREGYPAMAKLPGWNCYNGTKTQYANDPRSGGMENFIRCHLTVVAMLDAAIKLGFKAWVKDDSDYWEHRDVKKLAGTIGEWDQALAALFGALGDTAKKAGDVVTSALDGRPDREQLEFRGLKKLEADLGAS